MKGKFARIQCRKMQSRVRLLSRSSMCCALLLLSIVVVIFICFIEEIPRSLSSSRSFSVSQREAFRAYQSRLGNIFMRRDMNHEFNGDQSISVEGGIRFQNEIGYLEDNPENTSAAEKSRQLSEINNQSIDESPNVVVSQIFNKDALMSIMNDSDPALVPGRSYSNRTNLTHLLPCPHCSQSTEVYMHKLMKQICENQTGVQLDLVILIMSDMTGFELRQAVRDTWLSPYNHPASSVRHFFLIGQTTAVASEILRKVYQEMETHQDLVQGTVDDSYNHLTHKTLLGLRLVSVHCPHARHVLKADHDVWVNIPSLVDYLKHKPILPPTGIAGYCIANRKPIRSPRSKYYIPNSVYPSDSFPVFCNGPGYISTPEVAKQIVMVSPKVSFFPLEDVYLGFCLRELGLKIRHQNGFAIWKTVRVGRNVSRLCQYHDNNIFLRHGFKPSELRAIWEAGHCNDTGFFS